MSAQFGQLAASGEDSPQVTVQALPSSRGAHAASGCGPLAVLELAGTPSLGLVCLRSLSDEPGGSVSRPRLLLRPAALHVLLDFLAL